MEDAAIEKLRELLEANGRGVVVEPSRCASLLKDYCGAYRREAAILIGALNEGIPSRLIQSETAAGTISFASLSHQLHQTIGLSDEAAQWTVRAWSTALGVKERISSTNIVSSPLTPPPLPFPPPTPVSSPVSSPGVSMPPPLSFPAVLAAPSPTIQNAEAQFQSYAPSQLPEQSPPIRGGAALETRTAELWLRITWYVAIGCAAYSTVVRLAGIPVFYPAPWIYLETIQNAVAIVAMGFGVRQRSRFCAILLLSYHLLGTLAAWMQFPTGGFYILHKLLMVGFLFFFGKGIHAAFVIHDIELTRRAGVAGWNRDVHQSSSNPSL